MNADGSGQHVIETALSYAQAPIGRPTASGLPSSECSSSPSDPDLFKVRPDGTDLNAAHQHAVEGKEDPTWSPDGTLVLFTAYAGRGSRGARSSELMVVPAGGGTAELFGPGVRHLLGQLTPDWTP